MVLCCYNIVKIEFGQSYDGFDQVGKDIAYAYQVINFLLLFWIVQNW